MNRLTDPAEWNKFLEKMKTIVIYQKAERLIDDR